MLTMLLKYTMIRVGYRGERRRTPMRVITSNFVHYSSVPVSQQRGNGYRATESGSECPEVLNLLNTINIPLRG